MGVLVRNKCDLEREVEQSTARNWAKKKGMKYFEVSARHGDGLNFLFEHILELWIAYNRKNKSPK